jgi:hypothetical protein
VRCLLSLPAPFVETDFLRPPSSLLDRSLVPAVKCPACEKLFSRKHDCTRHCIAIHSMDPTVVASSSLTNPAFLSSSSSAAAAAAVGVIRLSKEEAEEEGRKERRRSGRGRGMSRGLTRGRSESPPWLPPTSGDLDRSSGAAGRRASFAAVELVQPSRGRLGAEGLSYQPLQIAPIPLVASGMVHPHSSHPHPQGLQYLPPMPMPPPHPHP